MASNRISRNGISVQFSECHMKFLQARENGKSSYDPILRWGDVKPRTSADPQSPFHTAPQLAAQAVGNFLTHQAQ